MEVLIDISTLQSDYYTGQDDNVNVVSLGQLKEAEHFDIISYEESELVGLKGNKTIVKIQDNSVTMMRYGKNTTNMYFKEESIWNSIYNTDYGVFDIEIRSKKVEIEKNTKDYVYNIKIEYDLEIKDLFRGKNKLEIKVKQVR